ncbi:MAG: alpha/beta fold hydrolase [Anaerolineae bacterium]
MLNNVGIKSLHHLDTLFFNLTDEVTHTYTFRATANSSPQDYVAALTAVNAPLLVVVGSGDEAFVAEEFPTAVTTYSDGEVYIIDGENHTSIVESAAAMTIIERWLDDTQLAAQ